MLVQQDVWHQTPQAVSDPTQPSLGRRVGGLAYQVASFLQSERVGR